MCQVQIREISCRLCRFDFDHSFDSVQDMYQERMGQVRACAFAAILSRIASFGIPVLQQTFARERHMPSSVLVFSCGASEASVRSRCDKAT
jgi:hypothetical protein